MRAQVSKATDTIFPKGWERQIPRWLVVALLAMSLVLALAIWLIVFRPPASKNGAAITWQQTKGPRGGKINVLLVNSQNPSLVYAGTDGGVHTSQDGGVTWQHTSEGLPSDQGVRTLAVDPVAAHVVYAGSYAGVYRSTDSGQTWSPANTGLTGRLVFALAVDPSNTSVIYAGTDGQVFKSTDGGNRWTRSSEGLPLDPVWSLVVDAATPTTVYAGTDNGVFKSTDGGGQWQVANANMPERLRVQALAVDPQVSTVLYAATVGGVYRTTDGALTWQAASSGIGTNIVHALTIDPNNSSILYAAVGAQGVWQSKNGGEIWEPVAGSLNDLVLTLAINPMHSQTIYAGTGRGVYRSSSAGQHWEASNDGLVNTNVLSLVRVPKRPGYLFATTGLEVHKTMDDGESWFPVSAGLAHPNVLALAVDPSSPDTLFVGTWYSEVYRSLDSGRTWRLVNGGLAHNAPINALVVQGGEGSAEGLPLLYAGTNGAGVFLSADGGINWTAINNGLGDLHVQVLTLTGQGGGALYAGTSDGVYRLFLTGAPYPAPSTTPASLTQHDLAKWVWERVGEELLRGEMLSIIADERSPRVMYAATATGRGEIYHSKDGGDSWAVIGTGSLPTNIRIQALALYAARRQASILYAGTDGGIFRSEDGGRNWRAVNDGLPSGANVLAVLVDASRSYLYASIQNNGTYRSTDKGPALITWPLAVAAVLGGMGLAIALLATRWLFYSSKRAQDQNFERNWPLWRAEMRRILQRKNAVTLDGLAYVPQALRLRCLQQYVQEHGDDQLFLRLTPPKLEPANAAQVGSFIRNWRAAQRRLSNATAFRAVAARITDQLCQLLGFTLLETRSYRRLHGYMIKAPALRLKMPPMFPVVFLQTSEPNEGDIRDLHDLMGILNASSYLALLIIPDDLKKDEQSAARTKASLRRLASGTAHDFIVISFDDLYRIFVAKDPEKAFVRILLGQVDLTVVSPYVTSGPVPSNMFFGRDQELKTITRTIKDNSFAIVGGRKIGKTSILSKLHRSFTGTPDCYSLYLDCQAVQNYEDFRNAIETMWQVALPTPSPEDLQRLIADMKHERAGQLIVILLDEVDALLKHDAMNGERLFKLFRALSQEAYCRFIFCGGKVLHAYLHDPASALFNFCNVIRLSYLTPRDTARIVLEPMQEMGIGFEDASRLVQGTIGLSSCHPNVVQYICQALITRINTRGDRFITLADLDAIANSSPLSEYMIEVMWGNTTALERLITLLIILERPSAGLAEIEAALRSRGVEVPTAAVEEALNTLVLYSVLNKEDGEFYFTAAAFPSVVAATQDVDSLVEKAIQYLCTEATASGETIATTG